MKRLVYLTLCVSMIGIYSPLKAQDFSDPLAYLEYISTEYDAFSEDLWGYIRASARSQNTRKVESTREQLLATTTSIQKKIRRMPAFEQEVSLRDSVAGYFGLCNVVLKEDYEKILDMEAIAEQSYDLMEAYLLAQEQAQEKLNQAGIRLRDQMQLFAAANRINIIEGERTKSARLLEEAGFAIEYYNSVYLIFFKSYKQEAYLMAAVQEEDLNALTQSQSALKEFSSEGMAILDTLPDFRKDASLKESCKRQLEFYHKEAEEALVYARFFLKKEHFEKTRKAFDSKAEKDRTQEDVDLYNKAVTDFNDAVNAMNSASESSYNMRSGLLEDWNKASNKFLNRHVP